MRNTLLAATALVLCSVTCPGKTPAPVADDKSAAKPVTAENYLDQFIDRSVSPRDDFFHFAVGKWLKAHPIPPSEKSWGIGQVVQEETYNRIVTLNKVAAADKAVSPGSNQQKIGDFWTAGMDEAADAKQGFTPLGPEFERIAAIKDQRGLLETIAHLQYIGVNAMFSPFIAQDEKNSDRYALHLYQGGLGLPNRDYYFDTDSRSTMLRAEYVKHVTQMFVLLGDDAAKAAENAATVMRLETELAGASRKLEDLRDPQKNYNAMSLDEVTAITPSIHWREFLEVGHVTGIDGVIVGQPEFFKQVEASLGSQSLDTWKAYLRWLVAHTFANKAGGNFDAENFHFYGTILNGTPKQRERFKRVLDAEEERLGFALGELYVQKYFTPQAKERYAKLTGEVFDVMGEH